MLYYFYPVSNINTAWRAPNNSRSKLIFIFKSLSTGKISCSCPTNKKKSLNSDGGLGYNSVYGENTGRFKVTDSVWG